MSKKRAPGPRKKAHGGGHPKKGQEKWTPEAQETVLAVLTIGGTFVQAASLVGVQHENIFHHMVKDPSYKEQVMRARATGVEFRKMLIEDSIQQAVEKVVSDPRYTILAIFVSKARLNWSDVPAELSSGVNSVREIFAEIVKRKQVAQTQNAALTKSERTLIREGYLEAPKETSNETSENQSDLRSHNGARGE